MVVVDTIVHAIGRQGAQAVFGSTLEELWLFLTVGMRNTV